MKKEYDLSKMNEVKNSYPKQKKKQVGSNLSPLVIDYFKKLAEKSDIPYQKLTDLYLLDCVKDQKEIVTQMGRLTKIVIDISLHRFTN